MKKKYYIQENILVTLDLKDKYFINILNDLLLVVIKIE